MHSINSGSARWNTWLRRGRRPAVRDSGSQRQPVVDRTTLRRTTPQSGRACARAALCNAGRSVLDHDPLRHGRSPRPHVPDRHERHQRSHDGRNGSGNGRVRGRIRAAATRQLRCPARSVTTPVTARVISPNWRRDHGGPRFSGAVSRRTPRDTAPVDHHPAAGLSCGIMVTASHNPPSDNAAKVFWSTGGQLRSPHDAASPGGWSTSMTIRRDPFAGCLPKRTVHFCQDAMQSSLPAGRAGTGFRSRARRSPYLMLFSPLHGVGASSVLPVLPAAGFDNVEVLPRTPKPTVTFPTCRQHCQPGKPGRV